MRHIGIIKDEYFDYVYENETYKFNLVVDSRGTTIYVIRPDNSVDITLTYGNLSHEEAIKAWENGNI